jgi:hypothetical protein
VYRIIWGDTKENATVAKVARQQRKNLKCLSSAAAAIMAGRLFFQGKSI